MKLLLALLATVAFAVAKPTDDDGSQPIVMMATKMPEIKPGNFDLTFGDCSLKKLTYSTISCERAFYFSFRTDKKTSCDLMYKKFIKCYMDKITTCYKKSPKELDEIKGIYIKVLKSKKAFLCGEERFQNGEEVRAFKTMAHMGKCKKGTPKMLGLCAQGWFGMFKKDKGNSKLCLTYDKYLTCVKKVMRKCSSYWSFHKTYGWILSKKLNPFCNEKEIKALKE